MLYRPSETETEILLGAHIVWLGFSRRAVKTANVEPGCQRASWTVSWSRLSFHVLLISPDAAMAAPDSQHPPLNDPRWVRPDSSTSLVVSASRRGRTSDNSGRLNRARLGKFAIIFGGRFKGYSESACQGGLRRVEVGLTRTTHDHGDPRSRYL